MLSVGTAAEVEVWSNFPDTRIGAYLSLFRIFPLDGGRPLLVLVGVRPRLRLGGLFGK